MYGRNVGVANSEAPKTKKIKVQCSLWSPVGALLELEKVRNCSKDFAATFNNPTTDGATDSGSIFFSSALDSK